MRGLAPRSGGGWQCHLSELQLSSVRIGLLFLPVLEVKRSEDPGSNGQKGGRGSDI